MQKFDTFTPVTTEYFATYYYKLRQLIWYQCYLHDMFHRYTAVLRDNKFQQDAQLTFRLYLSPVHFSILLKAP